MIVQDRARSYPDGTDFANPEQAFLSHATGGSRAGRYRYALTLKYAINI
jgi:hypothetical protein